MLTVIVVVLLGIGVSPFFKVNGSIGSDKIQLRLAHGQAGDSEIGGTITPPVGNVLFVGCSLAKQRLENVMKSLVPFFVAIFISLMPVTYIPCSERVAAYYAGPDVSPRCKCLSNLNRYDIIKARTPPVQEKRSIS